MIFEEFQILNHQEFTDKMTSKNLLTLLTSRKDRTLLYGYTFNRDTHHTYLKNGSIFTYIYGFNNQTILFEENPDRVGLLIPEKRIYPETCDFEFCKLLRRYQYDLQFTSFSKTRPEEIYYGDIYN